MKEPLSVQSEFYQNLGKIFYAIAAADKVVHQDEVATVKKIVNNDWLQLDGEKSKAEIEAMRQIKITFFNLADQKEVAKKCLEEFQQYKLENEYLFNDEVKKLIWKTANEITAAFAKNNKSELIMLADLGLILKK